MDAGQPALDLRRFADPAVVRECAWEARFSFRSATPSGLGHVIRRDGRVRFRYTDSTGLLKVRTTGDNLHWYDVSTGCLGLFNSGNSAALSVTYAVTPKQAITSP